jgi:hypothetical protein
MYEVEKQVNDLIPEFKVAAEKLNENSGLSLQLLIKYLNKEQVNNHESNHHHPCPSKNLWL